MITGMSPQTMPQPRQHQNEHKVVNDIPPQNNSLPAWVEQHHPTNPADCTVYRITVKANTKVNGHIRQETPLGQINGIRERGTLPESHAKIEATKLASRRTHNGCLGTPPKSN